MYFSSLDDQKAASHWKRLSDCEIVLLMVDYTQRDKGGLTMNEEYLISKGLALKQQIVLGALV